MCDDIHHRPSSWSTQNTQVDSIVLRGTATHRYLRLWLWFRCVNICSACHSSCAYITHVVLSFSIQIIIGAAMDFRLPRSKRIAQMWCEFIKTTAAPNTRTHKLSKTTGCDAVTLERWAFGRCVTVSRFRLKNVCAQRQRRNASHATKLTLFLFEFVIFFLLACVCSFWKGVFYVMRQSSHSCCVRPKASSNTVGGTAKRLVRTTRVLKIYGLTSTSKMMITRKEKKRQIRPNGGSSDQTHRMFPFFFHPSISVCFVDFSISVIESWQLIRIRCDKNRFIS